MRFDPSSCARRFRKVQRALPEERHPAAALSTANETGEGPLTLSVAPRASPAFRPASLEAPRTAFPALSSWRTASSIQSAFRRQVLLGTALACALFLEEPATVASALPPKRGSRRAFTAPRLSPGAARPIAISRGSSPRDAKGRTPLADFCNHHDPRARPRITRTPHTALRVAPKRSLLAFSLSRAGSLSGASRATGGSGEPAEISRVRGRLKDLRPPCAAPPGAIARAESFAPTRSARTPPVA